MRIKSILIPASAILILTLFLFFLIPQKTPDVHLDMGKVNDIVKTLSLDWDKYVSGSGNLPFGQEIDYVIVTAEGIPVAATRDGLNVHINDAIRNRDTLVDIAVDGELVGKVMFYNNSGRILEQNRMNFIIYSTATWIALALILACYTLYLYSTLLRPFKKMQGFARQIAAGNFDIPLEMDKGNLFGAFTESFDLMREELHEARENEHRADRSKKELVASLSHDIKTPVASIKSAAELMLFTVEDEEYRIQLEGINTKAEQINSLITNMFHSTLEELEALSVSVAEIQSTVIPILIRYADYEKRIKPFELPNCLIIADISRLEQVLDNIIGNSYKYAGTDIEIQGFLEGQYLVIELIDFGEGVPEEELPLIANKFYRGKNSVAKSGYGLGLFIAKYLMEQMSGDFCCENRSNGFCVRLMLRMADRHIG